MPKRKRVTLSIVIPVFNEERYLRACLDSIAAQTVKPDEVIVVDNNSTDKSVQIAKGYKFVKLLHEKRQHQVFAQYTGFNAAKSDIIGRVDGDVLLPMDWVKKIKIPFDDEGVVAVTGGLDTYDIYLRRTANAVYSFFMRTTELIAGCRLLTGANFAIRKDTWLKINKKIFLRRDIWEDYDLSFCIKDLGKVKFLRDLKVRTSFGAVQEQLLRQLTYQFRGVRIFYLRTSLMKTVLFFLSRTIGIVLIPLVVIDNNILKRLTRFKAPY